MQKLWTISYLKIWKQKAVNNCWSHSDEVPGAGSGQKLPILDLLNLPTASLEVGSFTPILKIRKPELKEVKFARQVAVPRFKSRSF